LRNKAEHPNTSAKTLLRLASDPSLKVIRSVVSNDNTPKEALDILVNSYDPWIREQAINHPNFNKEPETIQKSDDDLSETFKRLFFKD
jgi:hypothetical protein